MTDTYNFSDLYDMIYRDYTPDIPFYVEEARKAGPPVLELACGTGRILIPIARAGVPIWGMDVSANMLAQAEKKVADLPAEVRNRISLHLADMRDFSLEERFGLIMIPFRAFLHLLTVEDQLAALHTIRRHLQPGGRLALNFFQPSLPIIAAHMTEMGNAIQHLRQWDSPEGKGRIVCWESRKYFPATQTLHAEWIFEILDGEGKMTERFYRPLSLRWIYRYEFEHLLARTGFVVEALYGDFDRAPFDENSSELVWIARRDG
jgi:ubiquinone/menaquinone biosynthesis C-methylase UbiE